MANNDNLQKGTAGDGKNPSGIFLRDFAHAAYIFRSNKYQNSPKLKFQFHVHFKINKLAYAKNNPIDPNLGLLVKSIRLPQFSFQTHELNQYNRKRIVQTKIKYDNIDISFHDDNANAVRNMWYNYYSYYYDDPNDPNGQGSTSQQDASNSAALYNTDSDRTQYYSPNEIINSDKGWGYIGEGNQDGKKVPFFDYIIVYGFNQHNYAAYVLINPLIYSFRHDTYSYNEPSGTMENQMSIGYEFVKYHEGTYDGSSPFDKVINFAEEGSYDTTISPITRWGGNKAIQTPNRDIVEGSSNSNKSQGYEVPNKNPWINNASYETNAAYNAYKNINTVAQNTQATQAALRQALSENSNSVGRNNPFYTPTYGATPTSIGTAGVIDPLIKKDTDNIVPNDTEEA